MTAGLAAMPRVLGAGLRVLGVFGLALLVSAHVGSPDVFFTGKAGRFEVSVVVRPPEVVPGVARVTVRGPAEIRRVTIRPVYWRAGSRGSPAADDMRLVSSTQATGFAKVLEGHPIKTFEGSLWLMSRGAYSVDVVVEGATGSGNVMIPVASVPTGRLALNTPLAAILIVLGVFLVTGLVNIVRKAAGESLLAPGKSLGDSGVRTTRIAGAVAVGVLAVAIFGGARWWSAVDTAYERGIYRPSLLQVSLAHGVLRLAAQDTQYLPGGRPSTYVPDHDKLMHLFLVRDGDARAFAHLHPRADSAEIPEFTTTLPPLPAGRYFLYGDVVQETGFERTMRGVLQVPQNAPTRFVKSDPDDAWYTGEASSTGSVTTAGGVVLTLALDPATAPQAGAELMLNVRAKDAKGNPVLLEPYLGMTAHAVVLRLDGEVYIHLHPMGTVTMAAMDVFAARDRGDTTASGVLDVTPHAAMPGMAPVAQPVLGSATSFPYAFPKAGDYRVFVQVKRNGRIETGAFAVTVGDAPPAAK